MRTIVKKLIFIHAVILTMAGVGHAEVRMTVEKPLISLLERTVLKIEFIDTNGSVLELPSIEGLNIASAGQKNENQFANGKSSSSITFLYVITPLKIGDYTIGPVKVKEGNVEKNLTAPLRVIDPSNAPKAQEFSDMLFAQISTNHEKPYLHEPFELELELYVRADLRIDGQYNILGGMPESGLSGELNWKGADSRRVEHEGVLYTVHELRATVKALTAGRFIFQPAVQLHLMLPQQNSRGGGFPDPFSSGFFARQETRPVVLKCNRLAVDILPLPADRRPESFSGGVGTFNFEASVSPQQIKAGDPVTIRMRIQGDGNLDQITPPALAETSDLKVYEARAASANPPQEIVFEQVVIPKSEKVTEIPALTFSYFNPTDRDYHTIQKGPFPITVAASDLGTAQLTTPIDQTMHNGTKILGHDIVYLKPAPRRWHTGNRLPWYQTRTLPFVLFPPAFLLMSALLYSLRGAAHQNNPVKVRRQRAPKAARRQLKKAEAALRKEDHHTFYESLWTAIADYFAGRLNLPPGEVTLEKVTARLPQQAEELTTLFNTVEQQRYGMTDNKTTFETMRALLQQTTTLLKTCERIRS